MKITYFVLLFIMLPSAVFCVDDEFSRATLRGLESFGVIVHVDGIKGLDEVGLRADIESKLKASGITVIEAGDMQSVRDAIIKVEVIGYEAFDGHYYSFGIRVEVRQHGAFRPVGREGFVGDVETWSLWTVGMTGRRELGFISSSVAEYVEMFTAAYRAVNRQQQ
jgi:hypothetical protein